MLRLWPSSDGGGCGADDGADAEGGGGRGADNNNHPLPLPQLASLDQHDDHCDSATRLFFQFTVALMVMATTISTVFRVDHAAVAASSAVPTPRLMVSAGRQRLRRLSLLWSRWTRRLLLVLYCAFSSSSHTAAGPSQQALAQRHHHSHRHSTVTKTISSPSSSSCPSSTTNSCSSATSNRDAASAAATPVQISGDSSSSGHHLHLHPHPHHCAHSPAQQHRHYRRRCHHPFLFYHLHFSPSSSSSRTIVNLLLLSTLCSSVLLCAATAAAAAASAASEATGPAAQNLGGGDGQAISHHHLNSQQNSHLSKAASSSSSSSLFSRSGQASEQQLHEISSPITSDISNYEVGDDPNAAVLAASSSAQRRPPAPSAAPQTASNSLMNNPAVMKEHVCGDIDIRNSVTQFYELENCTVVEGHVKIVLIDNGTAKDFANLTFPRLREITDYFLLFRIMGLQSLKRLFPNLAVIRGRTLLDNYALVVYEMLHLQEIGLTSLTDIVRGDVRIEKNPNLCFVDTVDWSRIARNSLIILNKAPAACPTCNETCPVVSARRSDGAIIGDFNGRVCWTDEVCQKYSCPGKCEAQANQTCSGGDCCPRECLGGCRWSTALEAVDFSPPSSSAPSLSPSPSASQQQVCLTCRHFIYQNRCYRKCPPNTYEYFNRRCVTEKQCYSLSSREKGVYMKAFRNRCEATCPVGYMENVKDRHRCDHCGVECPKVCQSSVVSNIQSAQELKGCTIINGSLEIYISSGGAQIVKELEENLKDLSEITDFLKIARSYPLITLNFLRNLKVIQGNKLERQSFSLLVLDNPNLQDLWIFDNVTNGEGKSEQAKRLRIPNGRPFFHINPKLCVNKIEKMREYIDFGSPGKWNENEVSPNTNGDKVPCAVDRLGLSLWGVGSEVVGLSFEDYKPKMDDSRTLLGYLIYYRESEHRNVSIFDGRDACSDNEWTVVEYDIDTDDGKATTDKMINANLNGPEMLTHIIPNLKPYTQYALYIKTYTLAIATRGAQSDIIYFKTKPSKPTPPRNLAASSKKYDEFELKWDLPIRPNGEIDRYYIKVSSDSTSTVSISNHRDFCLEKDHHSGVLRGDTTTTRPAAAAAVASTTPSPSEPLVNVWTNSSSDPQQNMPWKKADGRQCCACKPTEKIRPMDVEQSINFEDFILNTVYVRRSKEVNMNGTGEAAEDSGDASAGRRRRRDALGSLEFLNDTSNSSTTTSTLAVDLSQFIFPTEVSYFSFGNDSSLAALNNSTTLSTLSTSSSSNISNSSTTSSSNSSSSFSTSTLTPAPEKETTYEKNVTRPLRRLATFTGLVHYTVYRIEMRACQDNSEVADEAISCSLTAITTVRTLPLIGADDIDSRSVVYTFGNDSAEVSNSLRLVHLRWEEPPKPNGIIHSYNIQHMRVSSTSSSSSSLNSDNKKPTIECISRASYLKNSVLGYKLELTPGNHSVQVRARSLFGPGAWTEELYIFVEEPSTSYNLLLIFIVVILALITVIAFVGLFAYKSYLKRMKIDYISVNPDYMSSNFVYTPDPKWEVPRENVNLIRELGQGSFGMVYEGTMINEQKEMIRCAVKTVNDNSSNRLRFDFLKEADVMKSFTDSFHVVKLLGIVSKDAPVYVLMEIMPRGDLRKYLRENRPDNEENLDSKPPALEQLFKIAVEVADGMSYLASKKFVHRDLAARNCMVADDLTVKIGDFGMTRDIYETDYYRKGGKGLLPVRWMSPESLKDGIFTTYSDVWSYGVVLWEMATLASQPYQGLSNEEVLKFVVDGGRMTRPENCPDILWQIMCKSWERKPKARPTFLKIVEMLLDYVDIADRPSFLAVSYYHQWKTSRTEKESMAAAAAAQASAAAALEVGLPANTVMENKEADDEEDEDGVEAGKDETLIPLRQMSRSGTHPESEEEGNSDYSTYEDDEDDQLNEEDTNVHFFPLSRDVTSDVRLFNSPEEVPEKDKEENEKEEKKKGKSGNASPVVPAPSSRKGSKEPPALPAKTTSSSPKTLNVQKDTQKEKKSVSLIGLHELLPVQRSSSSRGAASGLLPKETEEKKGGLLLHAPAVLESASSQRQLHSGSSSGADSGNGSNPSSNNNSSYHHHPHPQQQPHHLSANPLLSSPALPPSSSASAANLIPSSSSTSNVNSSSSYPFGQGDAVVSKDTSPRLANKKQKPVITSTASPLKPLQSTPPPPPLLPSPVTLVTPTTDTTDIDIDVDGDGDGDVVGGEQGGRNEAAGGGTAASGRGLINGHLINTTTTTSMV